MKYWGIKSDYYSTIAKDQYWFELNREIDSHKVRFTYDPLLGMFLLEESPQVLTACYRIIKFLNEQGASAVLVKISDINIFI